jgi:CheY-like chemotaxis protein
LDIFCGANPDFDDRRCQMFGSTPGPDHPHATSQLNAPANAECGTIIRSVRILVVEDDYFVALELEHRLLEAGYTVVGIARTAEEALALAASEKPKLAIMDIRLTGHRDGVDAAIELSDKLGVPSIFATAHNDEKTRKRAQQAGPLGWLQKPYSSEALIKTLRGGEGGPPWWIINWMFHPRHSSSRADAWRRAALDHRKGTCSALASKG